MCCKNVHVFKEWPMFNAMESGVSESLICVLKADNFKGLLLQWWFICRGLFKGDDLRSAPGVLEWKYPYLHFISLTNVLVVIGWGWQPHVTERQLSFWLPACGKKPHTDTVVSQLSNDRTCITRHPTSKNHELNCLTNSTQREPARSSSTQSIY